MTEIPSYRLWTGEHFETDRWVRTQTLAGAGGFPVILPLQQFLHLEPAAFAAHDAPVAVELQPADPLESILPHLERLAMIVLAFPAYGDGRSYSKAELLRGRHGFTRALRASGDILADQIPHMLRTGFSELEVSNATSIKRLEAGEVSGLGLHYQPAAVPGRAAGGYSWRRMPAVRLSDSPHVFHF